MNKVGILGIEYKTYELLSAMYGGFKNPVMKILAGNNIFTLALSALTSATATGLITDGVSITLNKDSASSASFSLVNSYNSEFRLFERNLSAGTKICVLLGYGSVLKMVFAGYIDSISYEFSSANRVNVTAMDAVNLMLSAPGHEKTWEDGGFYTNTICEIMDDYRDICPLLPINVLPSLERHGQLRQTSNDYDYIKNTLCKYCDRDFIIKGGTGYLINPYTQFGKLTDLRYGAGLTSLSINSGYKKVQAIVTGDKFSNAAAQSTVQTGESYKNSMNKPQIITKNAPLKTSAQCKIYANRLAFDEIRKVQSGKGSCVGLPDIVPGVGLGFLGVDLLWGVKTYYVQSVTHSFNSSGYTTSFTLMGCS